MERTYIKDAVNLVSKTITLQGWVQTKRDLGKLTFVDLRDTSGVVQCVSMSSMKDVSVESVIEIEGIVKERPSNLVNDKMITGAIEVEVQSYKLINKANPLPIPVEGDGYEVNEEARLRYRYLDLRRDRMHKIVKLRSEFLRHLRSALYELNFNEIETPLLTKSTQEGARDFIVPSRFHPGKFYALPQSPQQYKQLLMTAGVERYFQVAKCIRDEDLRADRGFEFTQVDLEMSFVNQQQVMQTVESVVKKAVTAVGGKIKQDPFPIINYKDAMAKYGADKFDLRTEEEKKENILAFAWVVGFPFFKEVDKKDAAEVIDGKSGWTFTHNPFSMPIEEHVEWLLKGENIGQILTTQYDLVCNGYEAGGGSIRAHTPELLKATYKIMGYSEDEIKRRVGHMLEAFEVGTPTHGGIGLGLDRLIMLLANEKSLKEVIAFPMTYNGKTSVMEAPAAVSKEQLEQVGIEVISMRGGEKVLEEIKKLLDKNSIDYKYLEHEATPTSEDSARVRGTKMEEGAKAIILKSKKTSENVMVVVPSNKKIDIKAVEQNLNDKFEFEKPEIIMEKFGLEIGGIPPFGNILNLKVLFGSSLLQNENIAFNSGKPTCSIIMKSRDLVELVKPVSGEWGK